MKGMMLGSPCGASSTSTVVAASLCLAAAGAGACTFSTILRGGALGGTGERVCMWGGGNGCVYTVHHGVVGCS